MQLPLPTGLTELQKEKFLALLCHYADVMAVVSDDLGCTNILTRRIETNQARPIHQQARQVPLLIKEKYRNCLETCCIRKLSHHQLVLGLFLLY